MDYKFLCEQVCEVAQEAGAYIAHEREHFTFADVEFKGRQNMVSYVDKQTERMVVDRLRSLLPEAGFVTEEGTTSPAHGEPFQWIIDPLDGTTNFIHGLPPYCVSIALMERGELVIGVVYEITLRELFYAWKGSDAYLNGSKITVSTTDRLENALIGIGFSYAFPEREEHFMQRMAYFQRNTNGIRRLGSAAADIVYTACGRFDVFSHVGLSAWDVAGGALIAQRAGARVTDYSGTDNFVFGSEIIVANPYLYEEFKAKV